MSDLAEPLPGVKPAAHRSLWIGYTLYLLGALTFALNGTVSKAILMSGVDSARLSQLRVTGAFIFLLAFVAVNRPQQLKIHQKEWPFLVAYGIFGVAMTQYLFFVALRYLPVGIALLIEFTAPVFVALWFRFVLKEPTRRTVWLALTVALIGLALVAEVWRGFSFEVIGLIAALGAASALSAHYLITDRQMRQPEPRDPVSLTMWGFGFAALFWVIVQPWWTFPWTELSGTSDASLGSILGQRPLWVLSGWMIVMGTVVPFWLVVASMRHLRASQASVIGLTEPLLAIVIAWLVLAESLAFVQLVGGALILLGVVLAERSRRQR
jgi:drug/metabolite transporter (DMT)-like permease